MCSSKISFFHRIILYILDGNWQNINTMFCYIAGVFLHLCLKWIDFALSLTQQERPGETDENLLLEIYLKNI